MRPPAAHGTGKPYGGRGGWHALEIVGWIEKAGGEITPQLLSQGVYFFAGKVDKATIALNDLCRAKIMLLGEGGLYRLNPGYLPPRPRPAWKSEVRSEEAQKPQLPPRPGKAKIGGAVGGPPDMVGPPWNEANLALKEGEKLDDGWIKAQLAKLAGMGVKVTRVQEMREKFIGSAG